MDISELLQEAKPLYFKRKKRNEFLKKSMYVVLPLIFCSLAILPFKIYSDINTNSYTNTSIVEQMGFPTDDYGLLKVD